MPVWKGFNCSIRFVSGCHTSEHENQWLGDFIQMIRDADSQSALYKLKQYLDEIEEINDYSKPYHHSNPGYVEVGISSHELRNYVKRTISLIENI